MTDPIPAEGFAIVGWSLSTALLSALESKGVLTAAQHVALLEGVLRNLEEYPDPTSPGIRAARELLDAEIAIAMRQQSR